MLQRTAALRGRLRDQGKLFSSLLPETRVPADHPLRKGRELVREVQKELDWRFSRLYAKEGCPSVSLEQLLSALLRQALDRFRRIVADFPLSFIASNLVRHPKSSAA